MMTFPITFFGGKHTTCETARTWIDNSPILILGNSGKVIWDRFPTVSGQTEKVDLTISGSVSVDIYVGTCGSLTLVDTVTSTECITIPDTDTTTGHVYLESTWSGTGSVGILCVQNDTCGGGGPGSDCGSALELTLGTPYTEDKDSGDPSSWYKCPVSAFNQYYGSYIVNSGNTAVTHDLFSGPDCDTLSSSVKLNPCADVLIGEDGFIYIEISAPFSGTSNYTVEVGSGPCP